MLQGPARRVSQELQEAPASPPRAVGMLAWGLPKAKTDWRAELVPPNPKACPPRGRAV